jgi:hypothetical protein
MKNRKISDAIGYLDGDLVSEAVTYKKSTVKAQILRWGALAACLFFSAPFFLVEGVSCGVALSVATDSRYAAKVCFCFFFPLFKEGVGVALFS